MMDLVESPDIYLSHKTHVFHPPNFLYIMLTLLPALLLLANTPTPDLPINKNIFPVSAIVLPGSNFNTHSKKILKTSLTKKFDYPFLAIGHPSPMTNCLEVLETLGTSKRFFNPASVVDTQFYTSLTADCVAAKLNYQAKPFNTSFIPTDFFTRETVDKAPYRLGMNASLSELNAVLKERPDATWAESDRAFKIIEKNDHRAVIKLNGARQTVFIQGRGDMDGDGIEDIVLKIISTADYPASYFDVGLYVLTCLEANGRYRIIEAYRGFEDIPGHE
ncbi:MULTISPECIES: hypothetical protein [Pseudomonas]|uniref:Uncharacterized protein n=1 Tax=Pseudomonas quercus TaxID=2722792 RepID=A0ABX0YFK4_9PSED|nr:MULTISPECIES: hypothetical protein [Pseudomonas]MBF7143539.1 hypothetical protein [Pseudomonas sp. LY10J]NJP02205.1 hypothetical protein [Pseudomonas quercus]